MASAITATPTASTTAASEPPILVDSIPTVDLRSLSQSELYSLSLCCSSPSSFDAFDFVIPKIDRTVFNESAGSRKQTYSRLRLAPPAASSASSGGAASSIRRRTPHLRHANSNLPYHYLDSDPEKGENKQILALFKQLFGLDSSICINDEVVDEEVVHEELVPIRVDYSESLPQFANALVMGQKRKRGRPRKVESVPLLLVENKVESELGLTNNVNETKDIQIEVENVEALDRDKAIFNKDGVEVDLVALGALHDPYEPELMRRTHGMVTEEALLEFMRGVDGRWGSTRKKRRIVNANEFGNVLPNGWSLLLAIKRKDGHIWLHCRRYISPSGRHFETCKEISSYLLSIRGVQDETQLPSTQSIIYTEPVSTVDFNETVDMAAVKVGEVVPVCQVVSSTVPSASTDAQVEVPIEIGDLPSAHVEEVLHCGKINSSHVSQNDYSQHQLSSQRRKKQKTGESITHGVIIKDGKFECQFCHKTFLERHRYNGHVGAHVRYEGKGLEESQATPAFGPISEGAVAKTSSASESNIAAEILGTDVDRVPNSYLPCIVGEPNEEFKESNDKVGEIHVSVDFNNAKPTSPSKSEVVLEHNESNNCSRSHDGAKAIEQVDKIGSSGNSDVVNVARSVDEIEVGNSKYFDARGMDTVSCLSFPLDGKSSGSEIKILGTSVDMEKAEQEKAVIGNSTANFSLNERVSFSNDYNNHVSPCFKDGGEQQKGVENSLPFPPFEPNSGLGQGVDGISARQMEEPKVSAFHCARNDELVFPFSSGNNAKKMEVIPSSKHNRGLEFRSLFPYENAVSNFNKDVVEDGKNQHLLDESLMGAAHDTYDMRNIYTQESKVNDVGNPKSQELSLAYNNQNNCNAFALERYASEGVNAEAGMKQMFGSQNNSNIDSRVSPINPKEVRAFGFDLHDSTFGDQTYGFESNMNTIYAEKGWEGPKLNEVANSSRNFMVNFDGTNAQPVEDLMSGSIWRTREENMMHTGPSNNLTTAAQSADCFRDFDVFSDKGGGLYGVNQKYDGGIDFGGLSLGRTQPVEHSFMTSQSSTSLPGDSKGFQYDVNSGLGFDSSFWLGRDALMPNVGVSNQVPTVCMWCRNEFYQEPIASGTQAGGAIGSMCPDCSSKVSSQFNM